MAKINDMGLRRQHTGSINLSWFSKTGKYYGQTKSKSKEKKDEDLVDNILNINSIEIIELIGNIFKMFIKYTEKSRRNG